MQIWYSFSLLLTEFEYITHNVAEVTKDKYENYTKAGTLHGTSHVAPQCSFREKLSVSVGSNSLTTPAAPAPSSAPASPGKSFVCSYVHHR